MIVGVPEYAAGNGAESRDGGKYVLTSTSPGYDAGEVLPNFSDGFTGIAPDVGAHEASTAPMEFGVNAYRKGQPIASPTWVGGRSRTAAAKTSSAAYRLAIRRSEPRSPGSFG